MKISINHPNIVSIAVDHFQKGAIIVFPTETCYGIGTLSLKSNENSIRDIFTIKSRSLDKPLSLLITKKMIKKYIKTSYEGYEILNNIWPNPVTIILNCSSEASRTLSGLINLNNPQTLAFRVPDHKILLKIIDQLKSPIIGTSANKSGSNSKYDLQTISEELESDKIQLWIDEGKLKITPPSSIIDLTNPKKPILLRGGSFAIEEYFDTLKLNL
ncbi:MAG: L-threonylcarbamoyladenylate synthase [Candidatus Hodarchaeales archaeon]